MTRKFFGTDGIRGTVGQSPITFAAGEEVFKINRIMDMQGVET